MASTEWSSAIVAVSATAIGASLTSVTVTLTVAVLRLGIGDPVGGAVVGDGVGVAVGAVVVGGRGVGRRRAVGEVTVPWAPWVTAVTLRVWPASLAGPRLSLAGGRGRDRAVLGHGGRVVDRGRAVVDLGHGHADGGRAGLGIGDPVGGAVVGDGVGVAVGAVVVGGRGVGRGRAVGRDRAVGALGDRADGQGLAGFVGRAAAVVGPRTLVVTEPSSATVGRVVDGGRAVVDLGHGQGDRVRGRVEVDPTVGGAAVVLDVEVEGRVGGRRCRRRPG